jgi:hypothetical protein
MNMVEEIKTTNNNSLWKISAVVFAVLFVVALIIAFRGTLTGNVIKADTAGEKLTAYLNTIADGTVTYVSAKDLGNMYEVTVSYQGQDIPVYITKDGKYFVQAIKEIPTATAGSTTGSVVANTATEVPKSDKPKVQAFIFSYCPYGLQFEKALIPVYSLLGNKADISIVAIGAMHGEFEHIESLRQISIEQLYGKDKLFAYLAEFDVNTNIGACSGDATCLDKYLPVIYTKLGIDKAKVDAYMDKSAEAIYQQQEALSQSLGISGSPTFVINGVESQVSRTPEAIKTAICSAFTTAPAECSQTLSTSAAVAGFGASAGSSSGATC